MKNKSLILIIILALGVASIIVLTRSADRPAQKAAVGLEAPGFELKDTQGRTWKLADLRNKVVMLHFWASWCDSCKEENPSIQRLFYAVAGIDNFVLISVLYRDDPAKAAEYMKANGLSFPVLLDDRNVASRYGLTGVPETFIIDKKGIVRQKVVGPIVWDSPEVRTALYKLVNE